MKTFFSNFSKFSVLAASATASSLLLSGASFAQTIPEEYVTPIYVPNFGTSWGSDETQYVLPSPPQDASVGYKFETTRDNVKVNALGMPGFLDSWAANNPVTVTLSSYKPSTQTYSLLRSATFTTDGTFGDGLTKYTFKDGYYWLPVPVLDLGAKSSADTDLIYETMAIANYSVMPYLADGAGKFADVSQWVINGFSDSTQTTTPGYPNGIDYLVDGSGATIKGFWNPNVSYIVPSPLPLFGAGVAFGYARRMRSRIRRSSGFSPAAFDSTVV